MLVDLDSTNGTFVDGERVKSETPIAPGASVRFGEVPLVFEPTDDALGVEKGGGTVVLAAPPAPAAPASRATPPSPPAKPAPKAATTAPPPAKGPLPAKAPPGAKAPPLPKSQAKRPQTPPPQKQGKGCGAGALVLLLGGAGVAAVVHWILA